jgi:choice-of-anchor C domain-containing protein
LVRLSAVLLGAVGALLVFSWAGAAPARAAAIVVDCTANPAALVGALASASDGDTLTIQGTCIGAFEVAHSLTLIGAIGATLDAQGAGTVLTVADGNTVVLVGLTVKGGSATAGGGVYTGFGTTLTLTDSTVTGNVVGPNGNGAGIFNHGTLVLNNSSVTGNSGGFGGGGIYNNQNGIVRLAASTISGNSTDISGDIASNGGGIYNDSGTVTIDNSTISNNTTHNGGGGLFNVGTMTVRTSTISGNTAIFSGGGGIANISSTLTVGNSTIAGNNASWGGGIYTTGKLTISDTTIALNTSPAGSGGGIFSQFNPPVLVGASIIAANVGDNCLLDGPSQLTDAGYNDDDAATCGFSTANHSLPNTDPLLDPAGLQENGGPNQTIALQAGSPAIDAIPPGANGCGTTVTQDQRGISRPQGAGCDIGAFEVQEPGGGGNVVIDGSFDWPKAPVGDVRTYRAPQRFSIWHVASGSVDIADQGYWQPAEGKQSLDLSGDDAGTIFQDLPTVDGQKYSVTFSMAGNVVCGPAVKQLAVSWDGQQVATEAFDTTGRSRTDMGWVQHKLTVVAAGPSSRLGFQSLTAGACGPAIDRVRVKPVSG